MIDISKTIDQSLVSLLEAVRQAAAERGIPFFVVGAKARDMILRHAYEQPVRRVTRDTDIAIRVADWQAYDDLTALLISTGSFARTDRQHRFLFSGSEIVDILPFGPIAGDNGKIAWSPGEDKVMTVQGFDEAFRSATRVLVRREPPVEVLVSTPAGLALMKLVAWDEGFPERSRDADDFYYIAMSYMDAGNSERLYGDDADLLDVEDFDYVAAGARLLGRDMATIAAVSTRRRVQDIMDREADAAGSLRLVSDIIRERLTLQESFDDVLRLVDTVRVGFNDSLTARGSQRP